MYINIPDYVEDIIDRLIDHGFEAYIVGGSVRDSVMGKIPSDYDVTTSASPDEIENVFEGYKTFSPGREFGTIVVVSKEGNTEITTYRVEGKYSDGRRPDFVEFTSSLKEDLKRRDFTINAMTYNHKEGLIDPFDGVKDIKDGLIRCVGNPYIRLNEDYLRILRAVRFATQLDFLIDIETSNACMELSSKLDLVSIERIRDEFFKIILSNKPSNGILLMRSLGLLKEIIPELIPAIGFDQRNPHHDRSVFQHTLLVLDNTPPVLHLRLAALLHDIGKPYTFTIDPDGIGHFYGHDKESVKIGKEFLIRIRCSTKLIEETLNLVKEHMNHSPKMKTKAIKRQLQRIGEDNMRNLISLQIADRLSKNGRKDIEYLLEKKRQVDEIIDNNEPYKKAHLAINGNDLKEIGYKEGKIIGKILEYLLNYVLDNPQGNNKEELLKIVNKLYPLE